MTVNLYISSTQNFSGKSAVCVAIMHRLQQDGYRIGYLKPFASAARVLSESTVDEDARFVKNIFDLPEPLDTLAPVVLTNQQVRQSLTGQAKDYGRVVQEAAKTVAEGKDIVAMEGSANFREGRVVGLSPAQTVDLVDAKAIAVIGYIDSLQVIDDALTAAVRMGDRLAGVIINNVRANRMDYVNNQVRPYLHQRGVELLAVLPHQRVLSSIDVCDIVSALDGELVGEDDCGDALVENLMIAAMDVEQALKHFRRVTNKAVIVGGDRPDIQLVALETSTKALILTGNVRPNPMIQAKAEELGVAIILSQYDTFTTVEKVEAFLGKTRIHQMKKIQRFENMLADELDFEALYKKLGLTK